MSQSNSPKPPEHNPAPGAVTIQWPNHPAMVAALFKPMGGHGASLIHAAVGMAGEIAELLEATDLDNIIEELGDWRFYREAAWQDLVKEGAFRPKSVVMVASWYGQTLTELAIWNGKFLDAAKKVWVYNKPYDIVGLTDLLMRCDAVMEQFIAQIGVTWDLVDRHNMVKLSKRYPKGYTDAAAQTRADKAAS